MERQLLQRESSFTLRIGQSHIHCRTSVEVVPRVKDGVEDGQCISQDTVLHAAVKNNSRISVVHRFASHSQPLQAVHTVLILGPRLVKQPLPGNITNLIASVGVGGGIVGRAWQAVFSLLKLKLGSDKHNFCSHIPHPNKSYDQTCYLWDREVYYDPKEGQFTIF